MSAPARRVTKAEVQAVLDEWDKVKKKTQQLRAPTKEEALRLVLLESSNDSDPDEDKKVAAG